jgi:hypothetical protein
MPDVTIPLGLTVSYEEASEQEEEAAWADGSGNHNGWAVVKLNGTIQVARLRLGFVKWSDGGPSSALVEAVADWLACRGKLPAVVPQPGRPPRHVGVRA